MLRKEQEVEAKNMEKLREQRNHLDHCEQQLLTTKHRLIEARKSSSADVSAHQLLDKLREETRKNRDLAREVLGRELADKTERWQKIEMLLQEPMTTQADLEKLTNEVRRLQRECQTLEDKLAQNTPQEDKLAIYKTQAQAVSKKKEQKVEQLRTL